MSKPRAYDLTKGEEIKRWFREMKEYMKTSKFLTTGTDFKGRKFAADAMDGIEILALTDFVKEDEEKTALELFAEGRCQESINRLVDDLNTKGI